MTSDLERKRSTRLSAKPVSQTPSFSGFVREAGTSIRRSFTALEKSGKREDKQSLQADVSSIEVADSPPGEDGGEDGHESDGSSSTGSYESQERPFPNLNYTSLFIFHQMTPPRNIAIKMYSSFWFEKVSMAVILLNCVTLGMFQPCEDRDHCVSRRCHILEFLDLCISVFFMVEMAIKVLAMGCWGEFGYFRDTWNKLDAFIVFSSILEYTVNLENVSISAVRTVRVLRPLRAINRVPSLRILVMLLLDTLPMLGNVLMLCFFVFFIFGIIAVQLWSGRLRSRCFLNETMLEGINILPDYTLPKYYETGKYPGYGLFICSTSVGGSFHCEDLPLWQHEQKFCEATFGNLDTLKLQNVTIHRPIFTDFKVRYFTSYFVHIMRTTKMTN
ncbi:voltage-dependent T-type calcium channel subunit alpha-1I-like [Convolutriloba macropyga]|uniref:voltage-dependent T-type calcium channel subunit alpha-1I-like n=1 Tax=Convolutriloba macropyga TaxID=536237 RepID=UPI003F526591